MTQLSAQAAGIDRFHETALRGTLQVIATRVRATEDDISKAIPTVGSRGQAWACRTAPSTPTKGCTSGPSGTG